MNKEDRNLLIKQFKYQKETNKYFILITIIIAWLFGAPQLNIPINLYLIFSSIGIILFGIWGMITSYHELEYEDYILKKKYSLLYKSGRLILKSWWGISLIIFGILVLIPIL